MNVIYKYCGKEGINIHIWALTYKRLTGEGVVQSKNR
jgi:hypothetical protein